MNLAFSYTVGDESTPSPTLASPPSLPGYGPSRVPNPSDMVRDFLIRELDEEALRTKHASIEPWLLVALRGILSSNHDL